MDWVWVTGCVNMAASLAFSAVAHHSKKLDEAAKVSMHRAVGVHQLSAIGFLLLASQYRETPKVPLALLTVATVLFPGVIYFQSLMKVKSPLARFVPLGGMLQMAFWVSLCVYKPE